MWRACDLEGRGGFWIYLRLNGQNMKHVTFHYARTLVRDIFSRSWRSPVLDKLQIAKLPAGARHNPLIATLTQREKSIHFFL